MAVVVGRMIAILEAQTAAFEARMTAAGQQLNRFTSVTGNAHRGAALLRSGLQSLAIDGLGAIPGPLGRVVAGFGSLALGSTVAVGVLAFFSLSKLLMDKQTEAAEKFAKRLEELRRQFIQLQDKGVGSLRLQIADVNNPSGQQSTAALQKRSDELVKTITILQRYGGASPGGAPGAQFYVRELTGIQLELLYRKGITEELERQIRLLQQRAREERQHADAMRFHRLFPSEFVGPFGGLASSYAASLGTGGGPPLGPGRPIGQFYGPFGGLATSAQASLGARGKPQPGFELSPQVMSMLLMSMMAMQQGGAGAGLAAGGMLSALSGMPGIAGKAAAGPLGWIGFGISALATIFGSKSDEAKAQRERLHRELIGVLREGPSRISNYFEGDAEQSRYENRRLERLGGEPRNGGM